MPGPDWVLLNYVLHTILGLQYTHRLMAATVEEVIVLASDGVGVRVSVEPRTEDAEQPGMVPLLAATVPVPEAVATQDGGRFLFFLRRCCNCAGPACDEEPSRLLLTLLRGCWW